MSSRGTSPYNRGGLHEDRHEHGVTAEQLDAQRRIREEGIIGTFLALRDLESHDRRQAQREFYESRGWDLDATFTLFGSERSVGDWVSDPVGTFGGSTAEAVADAAAAAAGGGDPAEPAGPGRRLLLLALAGVAALVGVLAIWRAD